MDEIQRQCKRYILWAVTMTCCLNLICHYGGRMVTSPDILALPTYVGCIFTVMTSVAVALIWKKVATSAPDSLPTFFMAVSGFRMLLALFTLLGCYIAVGRALIAPYVVIFMIYYLSAVAFHAVFFARINNK